MFKIEHCITRYRNPILVVAALASIALSELVFHNVECFYRQAEISRLLRDSNESSGVSITSLERVEFHRDRLVELGVMIHFRHKFEQVPVTPDSHRWILHQMSKSFPNNSLSLLSIDNWLDVYDFRSNEAAWHDFISRVDSHEAFREGMTRKEDETKRD